MPQALIFNGTAGRVDIPSKSSAGGARRLLLVDFLSLDSFDNRCLVGNDLVGNSNSIRVITSTQIGVRIGTGTARLVNLSPELPSGEFTLEVFKNANNTITVNVNGVQVGSAAAASTDISSVDTYQYIGQCGNALRLHAKVKRMVILNDEYINNGDNTATTWGDGTLNGLTPPACWQSYSAGITPITFTGTIPAQSFTAGQAVSVDLAPYFSGTQTPFTFSNTGAALTGTGLTLSSVGLLSGTATTSSVTGVVITGTDASLNTATSNAFNITISAAASVPAGTPVVGTITTGETTATIPFTYGLGDATGFERQLGNGTITATTSPISLTGLTAGTPYQIRVRANNATGAGAWSAYSDFTTNAVAPINAVFTSEPLRNNTGTLLANTPLDYVAFYNNTTGALVLRVTGLSTNSNGRFIVENSSLSAATLYKVDWQVTSTGVSRMPVKATT